MGTEVLVEYPWGIFHKAKLMCSDGKVRATSRMATTADTFFSVPCSVSMWDSKAGKNVTVSGYMTCSSVTGSDVVTEDDPVMYRFVAYKYGKNGHLLPGTKVNIETCNTCGGTKQWHSTTEDSPTTLVNLGPCPDCTTDTTFGTVAS
jgi:hypothetical protein